MYSNILVPIAPEQERDSSEALELARLLIDGQGKITILSVLEKLPAYVETHFPEGQIEHNIEMVSQTLSAAVENGDDVKVAVVEGHSSQTILEWAETHANDCIVVSSHRPGFQDYFLGSTAGRVVRHAQCPVMVLR